MRAPTHRDYAYGEEFANWISHGAAALASVAGLVVLALLAIERGDTWHLVGCSIFGVTMVLLFAASTVYHAVPIRLAHLKSRWQAIDQSAIYLLIAGSYTPFVLGNLRNAVGWSLLAFVWSAAVFGIASEWTGRASSMKLRLGIYLSMGWVAVFAARPIYGALPAEGIWLIGLGGVAYSSGLIFFLWRSLRFHHAIWHLFVIAGTLSHYLAVLYYVLPAANAT